MTISNHTPVPSLTVGSLFSGIGGLDLGFERAGFQVKWQVEIDEYCRKVLTKHWPDVPKYEDVKDVGAHNLERVDVIVGGFPCQDISFAGRGAGITGERSGLWTEFARTVGELRPRYVVIENVPALVHRGLEQVLGDLARHGYDASWGLVSAASVGAPHIRERLFIVAYAGSIPPQRQRGLREVGSAQTAHQGREAERQRLRDASDGSGEVLAGTRGRRQQVRLTGHYESGREAPQAGGTQADRTSGCCEATTHTNSTSMAEPRSSLPNTERYGLEEQGDTRISGGPPTAITNSGWWAVEPNVRGMAHELPQELDGGGINASTRMGAKAHSSSSTEENLSALWWEWLIGLAPHRRQSEEQLISQFADTLRQLPHEDPLGNGQACYLTASAFMRRLRQTCEALRTLRNSQVTTLEAWQSLTQEEKDWARMGFDGGDWVAEWPGVPRVAKGIPNRVNRLKGLGNAVVPAVAEYVARCVLAHAGLTE